MAVYRVNKNRGYTVMANYHLRDKTLSLKAVGLLSKMLSFNDGWQFSTKGLSAICKEGPDAVLAALRELEDHGYLMFPLVSDSLEGLQKPRADYAPSKLWSKANRASLISKTL